MELNLLKVVKCNVKNMSCARLITYFGNFIFGFFVTPVIFYMLNFCLAGLARLALQTENIIPKNDATKICNELGV